MHSNILVIGCGGIGCELAKLLYLSKKTRITFIDFDTISLTNLNRQFFFKKEDIGKFKSVVLSEVYRKKLSEVLNVNGEKIKSKYNSEETESVKNVDFTDIEKNNGNTDEDKHEACKNKKIKINYAGLQIIEDIKFNEEIKYKEDNKNLEDVYTDKQDKEELISYKHGSKTSDKPKEEYLNVEVYTDSIINHNYDVNFFKKFDVVYNCLDNAEARSYTNLRCLFANTPLVDGGSHGFLGQSWYFGNDTECYDCLERAEENDFPVCTIRTHPTKYEHCVIWAKTFFVEEILTKILDDMINEEEKSNTENLNIITANYENNYVLKSAENKTGSFIININKIDPAQDEHYISEMNTNCLLANDKKDNFRKDSQEKISLNVNIENEEIKNNMDLKIKRRKLEESNLEKFFVNKNINESILNNMKLDFDCICKEGFGYQETDTKDFERLKNAIIKISMREKNKEKDIEDNINIRKKENKQELKTNVGKKRNVIIFDKEDNTLMEIIYLVSILRCRSFGIEEKDQLITESIAGRIIPAISTTNSIVASLMFFMGENILNSKICDKNYYLTKGRDLIMNLKPKKWNLECSTCSPKRFILLKKDDLLVRSFVEMMAEKIYENFSIFYENALIYDKYFTENLECKLDVKYNTIIHILSNDKNIIVYVNQSETSKLLEQ